MLTFHDEWVFFFFFKHGKNNYLRFHEDLASWDIALLNKQTRKMQFPANKLRESHPQWRCVGYTGPSVTFFLRLLTSVIFHPLFWGHVFRWGCFLRKIFAGYSTSQQTNCVFDLVFFAQRFLLCGTLKVVKTKFDLLCYVRVYRFAWCEFLLPNFCCAKLYAVRNESVLVSTYPI